MNAFETSAILEDALHLTLREPAPHPLARECRVIVIFNEEDAAPPALWPPGFFDEIRVTDPAFARSAQGEVPPISALDKSEGVA